MVGWSWCAGAVRSHCAQRILAEVLKGGTTESTSAALFEALWRSTGRKPRSWPSTCIAIIQFLVYPLGSGQALARHDRFE